MACRHFCSSLHPGWLTAKKLAYRTGLMLPVELLRQAKHPATEDAAPTSNLTEQRERTTATLHE